MTGTTTILDVASAVAEATGKATLTPRWEATLRAFYGLELRDVDLENLAAGTRRTAEAWRELTTKQNGSRHQYRELWARVGRRGRKSFTMALVAIFEAAFGGHERFILDGEQGLIAVVSKDTAGSTLVARFCELHANALGIPASWSSIGSVRVLNLEGFPFGIACFPCNAKAPRGFAMPVVIADEIAFWTTDDESAQADDAVLGAIKPAMAQFPDSKLLAISSAFGKEGRHYATIEANLGDSCEEQHVEYRDADALAVQGPTWEWNPEITEARTHQLEKEKKTHAREYASECGDTVSAAFESADVAGCFGREPIGAVEGLFFCIDASSLRGDAFAFIAGSTRRGGGVHVHEINGWSDDQLRGLRMTEVVDTLAARAKENGIHEIFGDQREEASLTAMFAERGIHFRSLPWSEPSKDDAVMTLRRLMRDHQLTITEHPRMRSELMSMKAKLQPSGRVKYLSNGLDFVSCLITLGHAINAGLTYATIDWDYHRSLIDALPKSQLEW